MFGKKRPDLILRNLKRRLSAKKCLDCKKIIQQNNERCSECWYKFNRGKNHFHFGKSAFHSKYIKYNNILFHSSWELLLAKWCDKQGIKWLYESKTFDLGNTTYTPDFYLPEFNLYIETKGFWRNDAKIKFELFKKLYPKIKIEMLNKIKLQSLKIL